VQLDDVRRTIQAGLDQLDRGERLSGEQVPPSPPSGWS